MDTNDQIITCAIDPPVERALTWPVASCSPSPDDQLPLYTANPDDFKGTEGFVEVVGVQARPNNL